MHELLQGDRQAASAAGCPRDLAPGGLRTNHGRWTSALRVRFLDRLSVWGNVGAAAADCGLSRQSVYKLRRRDPLFAREWDAALARLREKLEQELARRIADNPQLAAVWESLRSGRGRGGMPGAGEASGTAFLDTVKCINPVSTAEACRPAHRTHSSPISS